MSIAAFRSSPQHQDYGKLAEEHMKHDLEQSDRDALVKASRRVGLPTTVGTLVGLGLGLYAAVRLRKVRANMFNAFRAAEKPNHVLFANGRKEAVPDVTPYLQPSRWGDIATYFFFGLGGTIFGGELGFLVGTWSASRLITRDPARKRRIETAYRNFKADLLRREAAKLEAGGDSVIF
ncbi:E3 ubiquitin-protein ligase listerin [Microdochium nivale]|nr:E3 ubiquitin-protein ligase listerin [Microdochium nivale]